MIENSKFIEVEENETEEVRSANLIAEIDWSNDNKLFYYTIPLTQKGIVSKN